MNNKREVTFPAIPPVSNAEVCSYSGVYDTLHFHPLRAPVVKQPPSSAQHCVVYDYMRMGN